MNEKVFCKGCYDDVTDSMYCLCGEFPLDNSMVYTETELGLITDENNED